MLEELTRDGHSTLEPLLTMAQVTLLLGVSRPTVYELIYKRGLPVIRLGKVLRFVPSSLQRWIAIQETV